MDLVSVVTLEFLAACSALAKVASVLYKGFASVCGQLGPKHGDVAAAPSLRSGI